MKNEQKIIDRWRQMMNNALHDQQVHIKWLERIVNVKRYLYVDDKNYMNLVAMF